MPIGKINNGGGSVTVSSRSKLKIENNNGSSARRKFRQVNDDISRKELDEEQVAKAAKHKEEDEQQIYQELESENESEKLRDPRVSKLFYLQLYSSVLKAEREAQAEARKSLRLKQV